MMSGAAFAGEKGAGICCARLGCGGTRAKTLPAQDPPACAQFAPPPQHPRLAEWNAAHLSTPRCGKAGRNVPFYIYGQWSNGGDGRDSGRSHQSRGGSHRHFQYSRGRRRRHVAGILGAGKESYLGVDPSKDPGAGQSEVAARVQTLFPFLNQKLIP